MDKPSCADWQHIPAIAAGKTRCDVFSRVVPSTTLEVPYPQPIQVRNLSRGEVGLTAS